jgi:hypothetical protein
MMIVNVELDGNGNVGICIEVPLIQFSGFSGRNYGKYSWSPYKKIKMRAS